MFQFGMDLQSYHDKLRSETVPFTGSPLPVKVLNAVGRSLYILQVYAKLCLNFYIAASSSTAVLVRIIVMW